MWAPTPPPGALHKDLCVTRGAVGLTREAGIRLYYYNQFSSLSPEVMTDAAGEMLCGLKPK